MAAVTSEMKLNLSGLDNLKKNLSKNWFAKVGYLGEKAGRDGDSSINNPTLAVIMEFGSITNNIPPRSTLRMPIQTHSREIIQFLNSNVIKRLFEKGDIKGVFTALGVFVENIVQQAYETRGFGQWAANKAATIRRKGSSAPLIDTGQLRRAVTSEAQNGNAS